MIASDVKAQDQTVGVMYKDADVAEGYTLLMPTTTKHSYLIDPCGLLVHEWTSNIPSSVNYLLPNGQLVRAGRAIEKLNWNGTVAWSYSFDNDTIIRHHDIEPMPNGNILVIVRVERNSRILETLGRDSSYAASQLWDEAIWELKPVGQDSTEIVWEWYSSDHTVQDRYPNRSNYATISDHPELFDINFSELPTGPEDDWLHFNSVSYDASLDQIVLSSLTFNEIYIIDHSTTTAQAAGHSGGNSGMGGDLIYRWGNPKAYQRGTESDQMLFGQHDPKWVTNGDQKEYMLVFNNRADDENSSVDMFEPVAEGYHYAMNSNGQYLPDNLTESYVPLEDFKSNVRSGAHMFGTDRIISCEATKGRVSEYDITNGEATWIYVSPIVKNKSTVQGEAPNGNEMFRATKYPVNYGAFTGKTLSPGEPLELEPWNSECYEVEDTTTTGIQALVQHNALLVYPNPARETVHVALSRPASSVRLIDEHGRVVMQRSVAGVALDLDLQDVEGGFYTLAILHDDLWSFKKLMVLD